MLKILPCLKATYNDLKFPLTENVSFSAANSLPAANDLIFYLFIVHSRVGLDKYAFLYYKLKSCANDAVSMGIKDERGMQLRVAFGDRRNFCRSDYG